MPRERLPARRRAPIWALHSAMSSARHTTLIAASTCICILTAGAGAEVLEFTSGASTVELRLDAVPETLTKDDLLDWARTAARAVSGLYGHFPLTHVTVRVSTSGRGRGIHGTTFGGRWIRMRLGPRTAKAELDDDWVLTHEMFHLAFPEMGDAHEWMNEGLSTYLEPIARVRIGTLPAQRVWREMAEGLPKGLPREDDRGLDHTHTWGRTYWGGCLFWFLADIRIRQQTHNEKSLDDALKAILEAGGDGTRRWPVERVIDVGDKATATSVLHDLYAETADHPAPTDLNALWKELGVRIEGGHVSYDDSAPLADVREHIMK